jgi:cytochrome c peroxidase
MDLQRMNMVVAGAVVVGSTGALGCSSTPGEEIGVAQQAIDGGSCSQVVLNASRSYHPKAWSDAHMAVGGRMPFALPAAIAVTSGAPGNHRALLTFGDEDKSIECTYKGNGEPSYDDSDDDDDDTGRGGTAYVFKKCTGKSAKDLAPGSALVADTFSLRVQNGDRHAGTTSVHLVLEETRPCDPVSRGEAAFHDRALVGLNGNGRACADCHMGSNSFQLSPANVEARFQQMNTSGIDDPLFRPIDADDFDTNGASASDYSNLRQRGLVRIRLPLPPNIKVVDPTSCSTAGAPTPCQTATMYSVSTATFTDVWRATPSVLNVRVTGPDTQIPPWPRGPNSQGGYQLDGRIDTLQNQALGAFINHAEVTTFPAAGMLDDLAAYEMSLLANAEPPLDDLEKEGKVIFDRACAQCHGGPGMTTPVSQTPPVVRFHDILAACPRPVDTLSPPRWNLAPCPPDLDRNARTYEISFADGFKMRRTTTDPGRALLTGFVFSAGPPVAPATCAHPPCGGAGADDWQKLEIAPLHGISQTAPYFHNNSAATLDEVVIHYEELFKRVSALNPPPALPPILTTDGVNRDRPNVARERAALVAYLKKL